MNLSTIDLTVLISLLAATVLIGMYFGRSKKSSISEYFLGGDFTLVHRRYFYGCNHLRSRYTAGCYRTGWPVGSVETGFGGTCSQRYVYHGLFARLRRRLTYDRGRVHRIQVLGRPAALLRGSRPYTSAPS